VTKKPLLLTGIAQFVSQFETLMLTDNDDKQKIAKAIPDKEIAKIQKKKDHAIKIVDDIKNYNPHKNSKAVTDPRKTLFVGRLNYETTEETIKRVFEEYGRITKVILVLDVVTGKSKGYCFIEYAHTEDMKYAYRKADGKKLTIVELW